VGVVALLLGVSVLAASMLVDVVLSVARLPIVDEALLDQHHLLSSRRWLLMNRYFPLVLG